MGAAHGASVPKSAPEGETPALYFNHDIASFSKQPDDTTYQFCQQTGLEPDFYAYTGQGVLFLYGPSFEAYQGATCVFSPQNWNSYAAQDPDQVGFQVMWELDDEGEGSAPLTYYGRALALYKSKAGTRVRILAGGTQPAFYFSGRGASSKSVAAGEFKETSLGLLVEVYYEFIAPVRTPSQSDMAGFLDKAIASATRQISTE